MKAKVGRRTVAAAAREWCFGVALETQRKVRGRVILSRRFQHAIAIVVHQDVGEPARVRCETRIRRRR